GQRCGGISLARVNRRNSLSEQVDSGSGVCQKGAPGLSHHIDETGGDDEPAGIDRPHRVRRVETTDRCDPAALDGQVGDVPGSPCPVHDSAPLEQQIVTLGGQRFAIANGNTDRHQEERRPPGQRDCPVPVPPDRPPHSLPPLSCPETFCRARAYRSCDSSCLWKTLWTAGSSHRHNPSTRCSEPTY